MKGLCEAAGLRREGLDPSEGKLKLILLGPPGAGKGTQSVVLSKAYRIPHISTGDILRGAVKAGLPLGLKAKAFMDRGELAPDEIVVGIVAERLKEKDARNGFILDGFPRTLNQAKALESALNSISEKIDMVVYFDTSERVVIERLTGRRVCKGCGINYHIKNIPPRTEGICDKCGNALFQRPDDRENTVRNRLKVYEAETKPLIDHYKRIGLLTTVSGDLDVNDLNKALSNIFTEKKLA